MEQKMMSFVLVRWTAYLKPETMKQKMKYSNIIVLSLQRNSSLRSHRWMADWMQKDC